LEEHLSKKCIFPFRYLILEREWWSWVFNIVALLTVVKLAQIPSQRTVRSDVRS